MTVVKISLAAAGNSKRKEIKINPFWFTTDNTIRLSRSRARTSVNVILEKLSERNLLELSASYRLGLIDIKSDSVFYAFLEEHNA